MRNASAIVFMLFLSCCAHGYTVTTDVPYPTVVQQVNALYQPFREVGFCLNAGGPHNIHVGSWMSAPMPICYPGDIVFHTHPVWAEQWASFVDLHVWKIYRKRYGHTQYGIMFRPDKFKIYTWRDSQ